MSDWELDEYGMPECSFWIEEFGEYCFEPAQYRVRPKGSNVWWAQACDRHVSLATVSYSDAEIEEVSYYKGLGKNEKTYHFGR